MRGWGTLLVALLIAALVVVLVLRNDQQIVVDLVLVTWPTKVWGALVAAAVVGACAAAVLLTWPVVRAKMQIRRQTRRIAELEQEVHGLRTLPIASEPAGTPSVQKV